MKNISAFTVVRLVILAWSAVLLTFGYMDYLKKMDATFIASIFTSTLATFGVDAANKKSKTSFDKSVDCDACRSKSSKESTQTTEET
jgi:hypothetical protein